MSPKKWLTTVLVIVGVAVIILVSAVIVIDPYLHFHAPLKGLSYSFNNSRYVDDGINRHYDYDALITGTSMCANFRASQLEELIGCTAVKTTFFGSSYHELAANMERAIKHQPKLKYIVCSFDPNNLSTKADVDNYSGYPTYLYDDNVLNDVYYVFNKDVLIQTLNVINYTRAGNKTPDFDEYERFDYYYEFGKEAVLSRYNRAEKCDLAVSFSEQNKLLISENVVNNYVRLAKENPEVEFYFFLPPYSCLYWDSLVQTNQIDFVIEAERYGASLMLGVDNLHLYGFETLFEITTDLNRYMDSLHYDAAVNELILDNMVNGVNELTYDNIDEYFDTIAAFYAEYDFPFFD